MSRFTGIIPPICTPLDAEGAIDAASLERLVSFQLNAGVNGIFTLGSSGEAVYLDDRARKKVLDVVVGVVGGMVPIFVGALDASPARVIDQVLWIEKFAVAAVVVTAPFYANVNDAETIRHFETIAKVSSLPVVAYDIPGNVRRKLSAEVCIDLLVRGVLAGLKDSSGAMDDFARVLAGVGTHRASSILTGADDRALESLNAGADGIVPGVCNLCPEFFAELYRAHLSGDEQKAQRAQDRITAMTRVFGVGQSYGLGRHASELGGMKCVLHHDGVIAFPTTSIPLTPYPAKAVIEVLALVETARQ